MDSQPTAVYWEHDKDTNQENTQIDSITGLKNIRDEAYKDSSNINEDNQNVNSHIMFPALITKPRMKPFISTIRTTETNNLNKVTKYTNLDDDDLLVN